MTFVRVAALLICGFAGVAAAEEAWETPDWKPAGDERRASIRDLLLVEGDSGSSCGDHAFAIYGSARLDIPDLSYCANSLKYRAHGRMPDFLISGVRIGSDIGGPSGWIFEDVLLRYEKGKWTETVILAIGTNQTPPP